jgi:hypothetical protein
MRLTNYRDVAAAAALLTLCVSTSAYSQTAPPPAFTVTAGANTKELVFDWDPVPGAVIYKLMWKTREGQYFEPYNGERLRRTRIALPAAVHLENWATARYMVLACNLAGCTRSNEIAARDHMLDAIGYFKASNTDSQDAFGGAVAISADGTTLAVAAENEDGFSDGPDVDQGNVATDAGAVYVYRRNGRTWTQEAYLKGYFSQPGAKIGGSGVAPIKGRTLALSSDGSVLAVGAPSFRITSGGREGAAYIFRRNADGTWNLPQHLVAPSFTPESSYGYNLDLGSDGNTLMVNDMGARNAQGDFAGLTHLYSRSGNVWLRTTSLPPYYPGDRCLNVRMSGNGRTIVWNCADPLLTHMRAITRRLVGGSWVHLEDLPINWRGPQPLALNYDGTRLAINYSLWAQNDFGIGVYRWESNQWIADFAIQEPTVFPSSSGTWGSVLEFDRFGDFLAVGDPKCTAGGAGTFASLPSGSDPHGCVHLYERLAPQTGSYPSWRPRALIKAPNPALNDGFGSSVALSGSAWYLAVGAPGEDSSATGIDGDRNNNGDPDSGAADLY